jgi:hypothetical protein
MERLNEPRFPRVVAKGPSQFLNAARQGRIAHTRAAPDLVEQLFLGYELAGAPRQDAQYLQGFGGEVDANRAARQAL